MSCQGLGQLGASNLLDHGNHGSGLGVNGKSPPADSFILDV